MHVVITNASTVPQHVPVAGVTLAPGGTVTVERTPAQLDAEIGLKQAVADDLLSLAFIGDRYDEVATAPATSLDVLAAPTANPAAGAVETSANGVTTISVALSGPAGADIYYTTDGTTPTLTDTKYAAPIVLSVGSRTIKAIAARPGAAISSATFAYTITEKAP